MAASNRDHLKSEAQSRFGFDFLSEVEKYLDFLSKVEVEVALRNANILKVVGNRYGHFLRYLIKWCLDHPEEISTEALSEVVDRIDLPFDVSFCWSSHLIRRYAFLADVQFQTATLIAERFSDISLLNKVTEAITNLAWQVDSDLKGCQSITQSNRPLGKIPSEEVFGKKLAGSWRELKNRKEFNINEVMFIQRISKGSGLKVAEFSGIVTISRLDSGFAEATIDFDSTSFKVSLGCKSIKMVDHKIIVDVESKNEQLMIWAADPDKTQAFFDYLYAKPPQKLETGIMLRGTNLMSDQTWYLSLQEVFPDVIHERDRFLNHSYQEYVRWIDQYSSTEVLPETGPTMEIDTWWHVHMLHPQMYQAYCLHPSRGHIKWHMPRFDKIIHQNTEKIIPLILRDPIKHACCCV